MTDRSPWTTSTFAHTVDEDLGNMFQERNSRRKSLASRTGFVFATLLGLTASQIAMTQQKRELPVDLVVRSRRFAAFSPVQFSPDGTLIAYTVIQEQKPKEITDEASYGRGVPWWGIGGEIFVRNVQTADIAKVTAGVGNNWLPNWSPDGRNLAFFSDRDGSGRAKLWIWDVQRKLLRKISDTSVIGDRIEWTPDSRRLLVAAAPLGQEGGVPSVPPIDKGEPRAAVTVYRSDSASLGQGQGQQTSDPFNLQARLRDIDLVDIQTGETETVVHAQTISRYILSPGGADIAYTRPTGFYKPGSQQILYSLVTVNISTKAQRTLASDVRLNYSGDSFSWSPDGTRISFRTDGMEERTYDCFVVTLSDGSINNISTLTTTKHFEYYKSIKPLWSHNGNALYFIRDGTLWRASILSAKAVEVARVPGRHITRLISRSDNILWTQDDFTSTIVLTHDDSGKQDGLYKISLESATSTKLLEQGECYSCMNLREQFVVSPDGVQMAYFSEDAKHDTDLWTISPGHNKTRQITHLNPEFDNYKMGDTRLIRWLSDDGDQLQGALLLPSDYQEGKRYPMIVWVYGGLPLSDNFDHFGLAYLSPFNMQVFATRGYAVFLPDAPQHVGTPMFDLAKTVLPGVNKVVDLGIADPDRLGVMGHSYGGYSTLSLIAQTRRFKAAIDIDGWGDLWAAYGEMGKDGTAYATGFEESSDGLGLMGGTPWEMRSRYIENSPAFYFERVESPLLVVHGAEDTALHAYLGDQVFVTLRRLGKSVEFVKYAGEGHDPSEWSYVNQVDLCNRMVAWFNTHLH